MEDELDEFEAMEAEAEALAASNKNLVPGRQPQIKPVVKPGQSNPNVIPSQKQVVAPVPRQAQAPPRQAPRPQSQPPQEVQQPQPLWMAYYQPEVVGVVNTQTGERYESGKDDPSSLMAQVMARLLNDMNTIIISGGYE